MRSATQTLDSRFLRMGDCFAHRFSTPGTFRYALSPLPSSLAADLDEPPRLAVVVAAGGPVDESAGAWTGAPAGTSSPSPRAADRRTHTVTVSAADGALDGSPSLIRVNAGDLVVWGADRSVPFGFRLRGQLGERNVDSGALRSGSVFTHAFGRPGTYEWADANGSGLHGRVDVVWPSTTGGAEDVERWLANLQEGALVQVTGHRAEPEAVQVIVGQTVVWAVDEAPGVTITDRALLPFGPVAAGAVSPRWGRRVR